MNRSDEGRQGSQASVEERLTKGELVQEDSSENKNIGQNGFKNNIKPTWEKNHLNINNIKD